MPSLASACRFGLNQNSLTPEPGRAHRSGAVAGSGVDVRRDCWVIQFPRPTVVYLLRPLHIVSIRRPAQPESCGLSVSPSSLSRRIYRYTRGRCGFVPPIAILTCGPSVRDQPCVSHSCNPTMFESVKFSLFTIVLQPSLGQ